MKELKAQPREQPKITADKKERVKRAKTEPIVRWEDEGGALGPDSGSLNDPTHQAQPAPQESNQR